MSAVALLFGNFSRHPLRIIVTINTFVNINFAAGKLVAFVILPMTDIKRHNDCLEEHPFAPENVRSAARRLPFALNSSKLSTRY